MTTTASRDATTRPDRAATLTEPTHLAPGHRRVLALVLLVSAQFVVMLDSSIVNVALPSIQDDLALGPAALSWVVNAYVLSFGGLLLLFGRIGDLLGRRRMFVAGAATFTVGTLLAATAGNEWLLLTGRVVQGAGAAALSPAAMSLLMLGFPGEQRARAMSLWGAASTVGGATGVLAGGLLTGAFGWSSVFLVTLPVTAVAAVVAPRVLDDTVHRSLRQFDALGAVSITGALIALVHGALTAADDGVAAGGGVVALAAGAMLLGTFVVREGRTADPLVPLELFGSRAFSTGVALAVLGGAARASTFVLIALYLQKALAMSPEEAGFAMLPTSVAGFVVSLTLLPRLLQSVGPHRSLIAGLAVLAAGHLWLAQAPGGTGYLPAVLPGLLLVATGVALSFTPTTMVIAGAAAESHAGLASGLASSATQVGAALGTAAFTAIAFTTGFSAAFTTAAVVALATAGLGCSIARR